MSWYSVTSPNVNMHAVRRPEQICSNGIVDGVKYNFRTWAYLGVENNPTQVCMPLIVLHVFKIKPGKLLQTLKYA